MDIVYRDTQSHAYYIPACDIYISLLLSLPWHLKWCYTYIGLVTEVQNFSCHSYLYCIFTLLWSISLKLYFVLKAVIVIFRFHACMHYILWRNSLVYVHSTDCEHIVSAHDY